MIIDIHVHPFCKEATWPEVNKIAEAMGGSDLSKQRFYRASMKVFSTKTSIDDYIASMDKEQYRLYLRTEMQKNDPRRATPMRW